MFVLYSGVDGYDLLKLQHSAEESICRVFRVTYISECYAAEKRWGEATVLLDLADNLISAGTFYKMFVISIFNNDLRSKR
jgi:hypothetical protein